MFNKVLGVGCTLFSILGMSSCGSFNAEAPEPLSVSLDDSSSVIIDRALAYAGGYSNWQDKKILSFDKKSISYDSSGNVTRTVEQHFDYMMKP
ncbi:MAG: hypothetical protein ABIT06_01920, partial [Saprospiraceae bacterium]